MSSEDDETFAGIAGNAFSPFEAMVGPEKAEEMHKKHVEEHQAQIDWYKSQRELEHSKSAWRGYISTYALIGIPFYVSALLKLTMMLWGK